jgi:hypothetical protein
VSSFAGLLAEDNNPKRIILVHCNNGAHITIEVDRNHSTEQFKRLIKTLANTSATPDYIIIPHRPSITNDNVASPRSDNGTTPVVAATNGGNGSGDDGMVTKSPQSLTNTNIKRGNDGNVNEATINRRLPLVPSVIWPLLDTGSTYETGIGSLDSDDDVILSTSIDAQIDIKQRQVDGLRSAAHVQRQRADKASGEAHDVMMSEYTAIQRKVLLSIAGPCLVYIIIMTMHLLVEYVS